MLTRLILQITIAFALLFSLTAYVSYHLYQNQKYSVDRLIYISDELIPQGFESNKTRQNVLDLVLLNHEHAHLDDSEQREAIRHKARLFIQAIEEEMSDITLAYRDYLSESDLIKLSQSLHHQVEISQRFFQLDDQKSTFLLDRNKAFKTFQTDYDQAIESYRSLSSLIKRQTSRIFVDELLRFENLLTQLYQQLSHLPATNGQTYIEKTKMEMDWLLLDIQQSGHRLGREFNGLQSNVDNLIKLVGEQIQSSKGIFYSHKNYIQARQERMSLYQENRHEINYVIRELNIVHAVIQNRIKANKFNSLGVAYYSLKTSVLAILISLLFIIFIGLHIFFNTTRPMEKAIQSLEDSEIRFKEFAAMAADWFWECDLGFRVKFLSSFHEALFGPDYENLLGQPILSLYSSRTLNGEEDWQYAIDALEKGEKYSIELYLSMIDEQKKRIKIEIWPLERQGEKIGYRGVAKDITTSYQLSLQLRYQAEHDSLTGLMNRHSLEMYLDQYFLKIQSSDSFMHKDHSCLCFIDLDRFKSVNDMAGHAAGDELLKQVSQLIESNLRKNDLVFRLGGDEFVVVLENCPMKSGKVISHKLVSELQAFRFLYNEQPFFIGGSVGLTQFNGQEENWHQVLLEADLACRMAKDLGRNRVHVYQEDDQQVVLKKSDVIQAACIQEALVEKRFRLYVQPIVPIDQLDIRNSGEILVRLFNEQNQMVSPQQFIPAAERYGLMPELDRYIIRQTLIEYGELLKDWEHIGLNVSGKSLDDESMVAFMHEIFEMSVIEPSQVCIEITETAAVSNLNAATHFVEELSDIGCRFALDDFGSGVSSFGYLQRFSVDYLKIDGCFVSNVHNDDVNQATVSAIVSVAHKLNLKVIAEYVENDVIIDALKVLNADYLQGYGIGKPEPLIDACRSQKSSDLQRPNLA